MKQRLIHSKKNRIKCRGGASLVEMVVSMLIFGIIMNMVVGTLSPAAKLFLRMQRLQRAQVILDNTILELYDIVENASGYVKICNSTDHSVGGAGGVGGNVLEFLNPEGYVTVVSTGGCDETQILIGGEKIDTAKAVEKGRLLVRYYVNEPNGTEVKYTYEDAGNAVARAVLDVFADGYYMGNYLKVNFKYGDPDPGENTAVTSIKADVSLYGKDQDGNEKLIVQEENVVLNLRYAAVRNDAPTTS